MRWRQSRESQNVQDYRGRSTGGGGGLKIGIGTVVVGVIAYFLGGPQLAMQVLSGAGSGAPSAEENIETSVPQDEAGSFVNHVLGDTEETWTTIFQENGSAYPKPNLAIFERGINTACGSATSAAGPFYCPGDQRVYIDLAFFRQLETEFAAEGDFAKAYVIAHEVGHHVQTITGIADKVRSAQQNARSQEEANAWQVKMELQADCYAGIWAHSASARQLVESGDIDEALKAASAVGDDTIQRRVQGSVNQESFTHGSGAQRQEWFRRGFDTGQVASCDTFK